MDTCEPKPKKEDTKSKYFNSKFKVNHSFDLRKAESDKIIHKYDGRIPIIVERENTCKVLPEINKNKFLVPSDLTVQQFHYVIRRRLELSANDAIYIFCEGTIPSSSATLESIYEKYGDPDGFLYLFYSGENTFG